jgi:hypothetical protein
MIYLISPIPFATVDSRVFNFLHPSKHISLSGPSKPRLSRLQNLGIRSTES